MEKPGFSTYFQGSTQVWMSLILLSLFSLLPVYSGGGALSYFAYVVLSWGLAFAIHRAPYRFLAALPAYSWSSPWGSWSLP